MSAVCRHVSKLSGYATALPTPFDRDDKIDRKSFERICELQILHGATALVVCGTTGEASTLNAAEHRDLVRIAVQVARGRVPVIAGAGSNATTHAIELSRDAEESGADAILSVVPYYNKPTQDGLYTHYREIAASTGLPIILHDDPARTVRGLSDDTVARLAEMPQIIGLMDETGDVGRPARLRGHVGADFRLLSGDDSSALGFIVQGGDGCISIASNVAPGLCRDAYLGLKQGNAARARRLMPAIARLTAVLLRETNPVPLKYALSLFGLMSPRVRLPLVELSDEVRADVASALAQVCDEHADSIIGKIGGTARREPRVMNG